MGKRRTRLRFVLEGLEGAALMGAALCTWPISKRWLADWGSRASERERTWVGDRLVGEPFDDHTRAIDIAAPAATVWQWLAQFGLDRAGFYSYELLERLMGIPVTNLESVEPTMQSRAVGDEILLHPKAPGIPIGLLEPGRHICFGQVRDPRETASESSPVRSWSMYIESTGASSCRLILRSCLERARGRRLMERLAVALEQPVDFVMEQRMLRTVKRLAET